MYIGENIDPESHTQELLDNLAKSCDAIISFSLAVDYERFGNAGIGDFYESKIFENQIDVLWVSPGESCRIHPNWLYELRIKAPDLVIIACFSDSEHTFECNDKYFAQTADVSLVHGVSNINRFHMLSLNAIGGQIFDFELYDRFRSDKKEIDISFIGGVYRSDRRAYFKALDDHGVQIRVAGFGSTEGWVSRERSLELIAKSKIHLNFSGVCSNYQKIDSRLNQFKGRLFETILLGTIPITQYDSSTEIMFGDYYALLNVFHNESEMIDRIDEVTKNFEKHKDNVEILRRYIINRYSPGKLISDLISPVKKFEVRPTNLIDSVFGQRFIRFRFFYLGKFLISLKARHFLSEASVIICQLNYLNYGVLHQFCRGCWHGIKLLVKNHDMSISSRN